MLVSTGYDMSRLDLRSARRLGSLWRLRSRREDARGIVGLSGVVQGPGELGEFARQHTAGGRAAVALGPLAIIEGPEAGVTCGAYAGLGRQKEQPACLRVPVPGQATAPAASAGVLHSHVQSDIGHEGLGVRKSARLQMEGEGRGCYQADARHRAEAPKQLPLPARRFEFSIQVGNLGPHGFHGGRRFRSRQRQYLPLLTQGGQGAPRGRGGREAARPSAGGRAP